eukprot:jgi/Hompol1/3429/HPOL_006569-RA
MSASPATSTPPQTHPASSSITNGQVKRHAKFKKFTQQLQGMTLRQLLGAPASAGSSSPATQQPATPTTITVTALTSLAPTDQTAQSSDKTREMQIKKLVYHLYLFVNTACGHEIQLAHPRIERDLAIIVKMIKEAPVLQMLIDQNSEKMLWVFVVSKFLISLKADIASIVRHLALRTLVSWFDEPAIEQFLDMDAVLFAEEYRTFFDVIRQYVYTKHTNLKRNDPQYNKPQASSTGMDLIDNNQFATPQHVEDIYGDIFTE